MILKLTLAVNNKDGLKKVLVPLNRVCITSHPSVGCLVTFNNDCFQVKETISEIEQQIKEGGITNGTN